MNDKISLLQKIKSLSERGVASEKIQRKRYFLGLWLNTAFRNQTFQLKKRNAVV